MELAATTGAVTGLAPFTVGFGVAAELGALAVGLITFLLVPLALFAAFAELGRFAAVTTTRAFGGGGGLATTFALGTAAATGAAVATFLAGLAIATSGFFITFAAAATGVFTASGAIAFVAGRLVDFGGVTGDFVGAGLRALLDGAFAVATAVLLVFGAVVLSDFFVVNL